ncbi:hypothetical protein ACFWIA_30485 [Streptomyces sp. NPDC127068]|uniref:hypothetical protein n=1 Tax=Streptomyces sp. NPDC127068 TaxID=3347127 RepID=UPI00364CE818
MATRPALDVTVVPFPGVEFLRQALDGAGLVLPSLAVAQGAPALVDLGRVRAVVALRLSDVLQRGAAA